MAGIDPPIGMQIGSISRKGPPENELTIEVRKLRETLERIAELMEEQQEANMRMVENILKEAHGND